jgi:hypothetical protein
MRDRENARRATFKARAPLLLRCSPQCALAKEKWQRNPAARPFLWLAVRNQNIALKVIELAIYTHQRF